MNEMKTLIFKSILLLAMLGQNLAISTATAATMEVQIQNELSYIGLVETSLDSGNTFTESGGGLIKVKRTGGNFDASNANGIPLDTQFFTLCTEVGEPVSINDIVLYDIIAPELAPGTGAMGSTKANSLRNLFNNVYPVFGGDIDGTSADVTNALALQIAVWEIVNETGSIFDTQLGSIQFNNDRDIFGVSLGGAAIAQADVWLQGLDGSGSTNIDVLGDFRFGTGKQDLIFDAPDAAVNDANNVPVPASLWLFGSALGLIGSFRKLRKN